MRVYMEAVFFSRGRGRGHAIPDMEIAQKMLLAKPELNIHFASYSIGAETIRRSDFKLHDLGLPDENPFLETLSKSFTLLAKIEPAFVIAHEEVAPLIAAHLKVIPTVFLTDWFLNDGTFIMQPLGLAKAVFFIEQRGLFDEPAFLKGKVRYFGPLMREMSYSVTDRARAREELAISQDALLLSCLPGGWATEARAPIADLLLGAMELLPEQNKLLFWIAGSEAKALRQRCQGVSQIRVLEHLWPIEQLMVASDLIITKGNRGTIMEAAHLGIPSISLSHGLNAVEDVIVPRIGTNLPLRMKGLDPVYLAASIMSQRRPDRESLKAPAARNVCTAGEIAAALLGELHC